MKAILRTALAAVSLFLILLLASCSFLLPSQTTSPDPEMPSVGPGSLSALIEMIEEADPSAVSCDVTYEDETIGLPLTANTTLSYNGSIAELSYRYDKLNPIGSDSFTQSVSGEASGDLETVSAALSGAAAWVWNATAGVSLPSLDLSAENMEDYLITQSEGTYCLTASPAEGKLSAMVGLSLSGAEDLTLKIEYTETEILCLQLTYKVGSGSYAVTATFTE